MRNSSETNEFGQPIGWPISNWPGAKRPSGEPLQGTYCRLEKYDAAAHGSQVFEADRLDPSGKNWTYLPVGPFDKEADYLDWAEMATKSEDPFFYAVIDARSQKATGSASLMRIQPDNGVIEVGYINYTPALQRTPAATEAMYLLMRHCFEDLGYRRYEWKCDALNAPSRSAAERLGFQYEGLFRQDRINKGRNRDTTWFSIVDSEWPLCRDALKTWLAATNFDDEGQQRESLRSIRTRLAPGV
ncbi:MAG: GNAT family protein [Pseudomonadota bacterium]